MRQSRIRTTSTDDTSADEITETTSWPELGIAFYDRLTGRNATVEYRFRDMQVAVPSGTGEDAEHAHWEVDGTVGRLDAGVEPSALAA